MTAGPLPPATRAGGARIVRSILADPDDPLARHKTLNYWRRRIEQARRYPGRGRRGAVRDAGRPDLRGDAFEPLPGSRRAR